MLYRIDDKEEAEEYGIETFPAMVYFDKVIQLKQNMTVSPPEDPKLVFRGVGHRRRPGLDDRASGGKSHWGRFWRDSCYAY